MNLPNFSNNRKLLLFSTLTILLSVLASFLFVLVAGHWVVRSDELTISDASVILYSGVEVFPRIVESAKLYEQKKVSKVVLNGNRKLDLLKKLEKQGFKRPGSWEREYVALLIFLGVDPDDIIVLEFPDVYDTVSEARAVGDHLVKSGIKKVIITTSKYHTARAGHIWERMHGNNLVISVAPATEDPFDPSAWWKSGRQTKWLMAEYGAWIFYLWNGFINDL